MLFAFVNSLRRRLKVATKVMEQFVLSTKHRRNLDDFIYRLTSLKTLDIKEWQQTRYFEVFVIINKIEAFDCHLFWVINRRINNCQLWA